MAVDYYPMRHYVNQTATLRRVGTITSGYGQHMAGPDPATDSTVNILVTPFDVIRRLAFVEAMGGSQDIRLFWVTTEIPMEVNTGDEFIVSEYGKTVTYIVQMADPDIYIHDCTVLICKKE